MNHKRRLWILAAVLVFVGGALGSFFGAHSVARNDALASRRLFDATSASVVSTLTLNIQHEQDLVNSLGAHFIISPTTNQRDFAKWLTYLKALNRYPELSGVAEIVIVTRAELAGFEAKMLVDPVGPLGAGHTFGLTPPGNRPYYCFALAEVAGRVGVKEPAGLDYCATPLGPTLIKAMNTGQGAYLPFGTGATQQLVIGTPIYRSGTVPATAALRRASFLGWTGTEFVPHVLLMTALRGHPGAAVKFQFHSGNSTTTFSAGTAPRGTHSESVNLHNGWSVRIYAGVNNGYIISNSNALSLLAVGMALSLLLGASIYALGTGRSRALALVKERTADLEHVALHDPLTGLPNRALVLDRVGQVLAHVRRDNTNAALLFIDLDNFKDINDTLGHNAGDQLLVAVGDRLTAMLREGDTVGRLGGDEFVVLGEGDSLRLGPDALAQRILGALDAPFVIKDSASPLNISASIGIANGMYANATEMLRDADIAMYRAKEAGKHRAVAFLPSMKEDAVAKRELTEDLRRAADNKEFFLLYQPVVDLKSGVMTGVEALLRWRHPVRGVIQPDQFIPALEESGLIVPVGLWVLNEACRQGVEWANGVGGISVAVNISARQMDQGRILDYVDSALAESGLSPELLTLELTETTLMLGVDDPAKRLHQFKSLGVRLAIDDFGTGYSSIAYLRELPVDIIKIDRGFVAGIVDSAEAAALVRTLIRLAKDLGLRIVAEGVETDAQRLKLIAEDADSAQGFLFARPLPAADVTARIELGVSLL